MKTKLMFVLMAFSIIVWAGTGAAADRPSLLGDAGQGTPQITEPNRADFEIWCNPDVDPLGFAAASQSDLIYPFEAWVADDFTSPGDEAIEKIRWWGTFFNLPGGAGTAVQPDTWVINFYSDTGNCDPGLSSDPIAPAAPLHQRIADDFRATDLGGDSFEYTTVLDGVPGEDNMPVPLDAGGVYWITIQAVMDFGTYGQWGWQPAVGSVGCESVQLFPFLGTETWTPVGGGGVDMAFCLYYIDDPIAVEQSSWGSVKALFQ